MTLLDAGADAVPAAAKDGHAERKKFRLISVGKKKLPDPENGGRKDAFWATVTMVGQDLDRLETVLGSKEYKTKTRGKTKRLVEFLG
jgi:hypothetical protein